MDHGDGQVQIFEVVKTLLHGYDGTANCVWW